MKCRPIFLLNLHSKEKELHTSHAVGLSKDCINATLRLPVATSVSFATQIRPTMKKDYSNRITPEYITSLKSNEIFVFGSNLAGMHGGGAARTARLYFGAVMGNGDPSRRSSSLR